MAALVTDDDVFNELRLVNEIWTKFPPQLGEKGEHMEFRVPVL
jgi:hypothetical protein